MMKYELSFQLAKNGLPGEPGLYYVVRKIGDWTGLPFPAHLFPNGTWGIDDEDVDPEEIYAWAKPRKVEF